MQKIFNYLFSPLHLVFFFVTLVILHPLLVISWLISPSLFRKALLLLALIPLLLLRPFGVRFRLKGEIPELKEPILLVLNHQSMYDIALVLWFFRKYHPLFVAKRELAKFIPSISFSVSHMGSLLINRGDRAAALKQIATYAKGFNGCLAIFPEGTRAKDGMLKNFKVGGFAMFLENSPNSTIVPVAIHNSWKIMQHKMLPIPPGIDLVFEVLTPRTPPYQDPAPLLEELRNEIDSALKKAP